MPLVPADDPLAVRLQEAVAEGTVDALVASEPTVAALVVDDGCGGVRSALHLVVDWPGGRPRTAESLRALVAAGADLEATPKPGGERPIHWAASNEGPTDALEVLIELGADIDAPGSSIDGGGPLSNTVAFGLWDAARVLVDAGATEGLWQAAALGHLDRVIELGSGASAEDLRHALWCAAHGGQPETAYWLVDHGADPAWVGHDDLTSAAAARRNGADELAAWLEARMAAG